MRDGVTEGFHDMMIQCHTISSCLHRLPGTRATIPRFTTKSGGTDYQSFDPSFCSDYSTVAVGVERLGNDGSKAGPGPG